MPAKSGGCSSTETVGAGGGAGSDGSISDWEVLVSGMINLDEASATSVEVGGSRASNVRDMFRASEVVCTCRASGVIGKNLLAVVVEGAAPSQSGEESRASIARREKRFGRVRITSRMRRASSTSSSALCAVWV